MWFDSYGVQLGPDGAAGVAGGISWDLDFEELDDAGGALYTFPKLAWRRELLPGAQIVPWPRIRVTGTLTIDGRTAPIEAVGAIARIFGHGNAERWCWLHADLGDGAVLEIVSATSRQGALSRLPMLAMVQLRVPGEPDWPRRPLLAARRLRTTGTAAGFQVTGRVGRRRIRVEVSLPEEQTVSLGYTDPDGSTVTCTNSERASAIVEIEGRGRRWKTERRWDLVGTAHAEIGHRP